MAGDLEGKVVLISGAARGMGAEEARLFASHGARGLVGDVLDEEGEKTAAAIGEAAHYVHLDVTSEADWKSAVEAAESRFGKLDVLVNNVGGSSATKLVVDMTEEEWDADLRLNLTSTFLATQIALGHMLPANYGSIINVSSVAGRQGIEFLPAYAASKAGVISLTQSMALQLAPYHVNVNCICPGIIWTPMWERLASYLNHANPAFADADPEPLTLANLTTKSLTASMCFMDDAIRA